MSLSKSRQICALQHSRMLMLTRAAFTLEAIPQLERRCLGYRLSRSIPSAFFPIRSWHDKSGLIS
jgi:hypothetical protein